MDLQFKPVVAKDIERLTRCRGVPIRRVTVCFWTALSGGISSYPSAVSDGKAVVLTEKDGVTFSAMPMCKEEDLSHYFCEMVEYFNTVLKKPSRIYLADEDAVTDRKLDPEKFEVKEQEDLRIICMMPGPCVLCPVRSRIKKESFECILREYEGRYE